MWRSTQSSIMRVGRAGVEGDDGVVVDIGDVADAAEIEHDQRPLAASCASARVVERRERRALAAGGDVGVAEAVDDVDAERSRDSARRRRAGG